MILVLCIKTIARYAEAMGYYKRSLEYAKKAKQLKSIAMLQIILVPFTAKLTAYDSAAYYLNLALPVAKQCGDSDALVTVLSNLGEVLANSKKYTKH